MFRYIFIVKIFRTRMNTVHLDQEKEYNNEINLSLRFVERLDNKNL